MLSLCNQYCYTYIKAMANIELLRNDRTKCAVLLYSKTCGREWISRQVGDIVFTT